MTSSSAAHYQPNDFFRLRLARIAAARLDASVMANFSEAIRRFRASVGPSSYFETWLNAIAVGPDEVRKLLLDEGERGQVLRSCISMQPFFAPSELVELRREHNRSLVASL